MDQSELCQASPSCPLALPALHLQLLFNPQSSSLSLFLFHSLCPLSTPTALSVSPSFHSSPDSHAFPTARASRQCHSPWCQRSRLRRPLALLSYNVSFWPGVYRNSPVDGRGNEKIKIKERDGEWTGEEFSGDFTPPVSLLSGKKRPQLWVDTF